MISYWVQQTFPNEKLQRRVEVGVEVGSHTHTTLTRVTRVQSLLKSNVNRHFRKSDLFRSRTSWGFFVQKARDKMSLCDESGWEQVTFNVYHYSRKKFADTFLTNPGKNSELKETEKACSAERNCSVMWSSTSWATANIKILLMQL